MKHILLLLATATVLLNAAEAPPFNWTGSLAVGKTVSIHGISGSIKTERAISGSIEVTALRTGRRHDPNEVQIEVVPSDTGVKICATYPNSSHDCAGNARAHTSDGNNDVNVAFTVKIPAGVNFEGHNVNGNIQIADIQGEAKAHTVNGTVTVAASESVEAHTVNGNVVATLTGTPRKPMSFHTVNGSIDLTVAGASAFQFKADTVNGDIVSDFPITVHGKIRPRSISGEVGTGGPQLDFHTVNGSVKIHRS